jgi:general secretion pathway protein M
MNAWLTGRRGQGLAVGVTLLVLAVVWLGMLAPLQGWYADRADTLLQRQALLQRMQALAASVPALRAATSKATDGAASESVLLEGNSDALAAAELQEMVQRMAGAAGASLAAVETLPAERSGSWHKVALRINLNAPWPVLMDVVRSVAQSPTRIFVDDLHFHGPSTAGATPADVPIQASFVLYGFRQAQTGGGT